MRASSCTRRSFSNATLSGSSSACAASMCSEPKPRRPLANSTSTPAGSPSMVRRPAIAEPCRPGGISARESGAGSSAAITSGRPSRRNSSSRARGRRIELGARGARFGRMARFARARCDGRQPGRIALEPPHEQRVDRQHASHHRRDPAAAAARALRWRPTSRHSCASRVMASTSAISPATWKLDHSRRIFHQI